MVIIAQYGLMLMLTLLLILHLCIFLRIMDYKFVWGGRLKSDKEMYRFETLSILINSFLILFMLIYANLLPIDLPTKVMNYILWIMTIMFLVNTTGNIASDNKVEKWLFTPITVFLTIFSSILALTNEV